VIQEAAIPVRPVKPNKAVNLLLGVILGSLAGLGFALVRELLTEAMSTPESAERRLRLPVLVTISMKG
jgi:tyrosine-protein kinase Etk/Wzc